LAELDNTMREVIDIDTEMKANEKALSELHQRVARGEEITELVEVYEKSIKGVLNTYRNSTTRQKYGKHEEYVKYKEAVWEVDHEEAMPPINDFLPAEEGDDSDDEDLQMGGVTQDYKCPLTLTIMKDPLTSKLCHHSYSADAIREYLARGPKACPAAGCTVRITVGDLEPDPALAKRAKRFAERAARHESDSEDDADEIVD
ncbi:hypothetical protein PUNSTDRAFT_60755, partial [Punctularia strigosozonata HHB-11173 SS5]|uniref:uncharacterized protein n=1 Tax=Punctularia strigosozonata (strain HHB-11173) TaxID=741275 RepID=UPI00044184AE